MDQLACSTLVVTRTIQPMGYVGSKKIMTTLFDPFLNLKIRMLDNLAESTDNLKNNFQHVKKTYLTML